MNYGSMYEMKNETNWNQSCIMLSNSHFIAPLELKGLILNKNTTKAVLKSHNNL